MDEELIRLLQGRGPEALKQLKARYGPLIRYIVTGMLPDPRDAEECVSDVYMKVWEGIDGFSPDRSLKPWLTAIARNTAVSYLRKKRADTEELNDTSALSPSPEEELLRRERSAALMRVIGGLAPDERRLLSRKYYYRQSTAQIAAELGLTERTVEGRLYRLRKRLKKQLGGEFDG